MTRQSGTAKRAAARRGRPPLAWLDGDALTGLPDGTPVTVERTGAHGPRLVGRILGRTPDAVVLSTPRGETTVRTAAVKRARIVGGLYEPGDPVLRRGVTEDTWRGGVVRTEGTDVLVEQLGGEFVWIAESELEPADARPAPATRRGPVPARAV